MSGSDQDGVPRWKSWYRWPLLVMGLAGAAMVVVGVQDCLSLWTAIRSGVRDITVETTMSAFPPLGTAIFITGTLGFWPRTPDGGAPRPIRLGKGREISVGLIVTWACIAALLLYPILGITLRLVTSNVLTSRGYVEISSETSRTSSYVKSHWQRGG